MLHTVPYQISIRGKAAGGMKLLYQILANVNAAIQVSGTQGGHDIYPPVPGQARPMTYSENGVNFPSLIKEYAIIVSKK